jgi:hypothetical protein
VPDREFQVARAADELANVVKRVFGFRWVLNKGAIRESVQSVWRSLAEGFVRTLVIVLVNEAVESLLLLQERRRSWSGRLRLECPVHSLVTTILLWVTRLGALVANA